MICTAYKHWNWAFTLLALATLSKIYPVILLVPFLLALQRATQGKWYVWRKWQPMVLFTGICLLVITISLLLNVVGTLTPLAYFGNRPVEVESLSASILWLLAKNSLTYTFTFYSVNVLSLLSSNVIWLLTALLGIGLFSTWWLQWRGRIDLAMSCLLTLLLVIAMGKVFSPQYLLWVLPLAAYVGQTHRWWLLFWIGVGYLTTWMYPYTSYGTFHPIATVRNFLLLGFILSMLISRSWLSDNKEQAKYGKQSRENPQQDLMQSSGQ